MNHMKKNQNKVNHVKKKKLQMKMNLINKLCTKDSREINK